MFAWLKYGTPIGPNSLKLQFDNRASGEGEEGGGDGGDEGDASRTEKNTTCT